VTLRKRGYLSEGKQTIPVNISHNYSRRETHTYGGADHIILEKDFSFGRLKRKKGDALCKARGRFNDLEETSPDEFGWRWPRSICKTCMKKYEELKKAGINLSIEDWKRRG